MIMNMLHIDNFKYFHFNPFGYKLVSYTRSKVIPQIVYLPPNFQPGAILEISFAPIPAYLLLIIV